MKKILGTIFNPFSFGDKKVDALKFADFRKLKDEEKTVEVCLSALGDIAADPSLLKDYISALPKQIMQNYDFWSGAIDAYPRALEHMPIGVADYDLLKKAVKAHWNLILHFEKKIELSQELVLSAFNEVRPNSYSLIKELPSRYINDEVIDRALDVSGKALELLPMSDRTRERCEKAFNNKRSVPKLSIVPDHFISEAICIKALSRCGSEIEHIPNRFVQTDEGKKLFYDIAAKMGKGLKYFPDEEKTPTRCLVSCQANPHDLEFVPDELKSDTLMVQAVARDESVLRYCLEDFEEMYLEGAFDFDVEHVQSTLKKHALEKTVSFIIKPIRSFVS
ncbi:MAG: hypothetical protein CMP22_04225 [Rickettsiales bacterium]|nr:hypothetical protein [Rickettsiales bacterium]|tara:strand:- start:843 stop:1847 length:1005 start_codon:yes stop_codon:yes gene_type:complete